MFRRYLYGIVIGFAITSCTSVKPLVTFTPPQSQSDNSRPIDFIENVSTKPFDQSGKAVSRDIERPAEKSPETIVSNSPGPVFNDNMEKINSLRFKYSISLDVQIEALNNQDLLNYMDDWYGTRYRYGGLDKKGIDCSAFAAGLMSVVYGITLPRTVKEQYKATCRVKKDDLLMGDLVFFNTKGWLSHVGVYLTNNKFVHASTTSGVMISNLDDVYYTKKYIGAGRIQ